MFGRVNIGAERDGELGPEIAEAAQPDDPDPGSALRAAVPDGVIRGHAGIHC